jgi:hypothetical protein
MKQTRFLTGVCLLALLLAPGVGGAERSHGILLVADPACRASKLVAPIEQALSDGLASDRLKIVREPSDASLLLQFFLMAQKQAGNQVAIQLDGQLFGQKSGRLWAEGSARSDPFVDDPNGQAQAAQQAAQRLLEQMRPGIQENLDGSARGRKVMLQVNLEPACLSRQAEIDRRLRQLFRDQAIQGRPSSPSNLMYVLSASEGAKRLGERVDKTLANPSLRLKWVVMTSNTMMLNLTCAAE